MSTKPTDLGRWANVGGSIVVPPSGKQDVGHVVGEPPPAQYENWIKNVAYQWHQYVSDGNFQGASTFNSTLGVTGLITATAGVTAAVDQHFTVSGLGKYKHGDRILGAPPRWVDGTAPTYSTLQDQLISASGSGVFRYDWAIESGKHIKSMSFFVCGNTAGTSVISWTFARFSGSGIGVIDFGSGVTLPANAGGPTNPSPFPTITSAATRTVATSEAIYLVVVVSTNQIALGPAFITYDNV